MFIPIVIDPSPFYEYRYLWEYLKFLWHCYKNDWAIIASEEYRDYRNNRPVSNVYEEDFYELHQYKVLTEEEEQRVLKYFIRDDAFGFARKKGGSDMGMQIYLLRNRDWSFEKELKRIVREIRRETRDRIEGFITWNSHYKSIDYVANKMHIPVITMEFSLRFPEYYPLAYFAFEGMYESNEAKRGYNAFIKEYNRSKYGLLERKELLALFLDRTRLETLEEPYTPTYEMGIAGVHPFISTLFAVSAYTDIELIKDVLKYYSQDDILFRMHPGDEPYQARYTLKNNSNDKYCSDFLRRCKRIAAQGSNVLLEALLWGCSVYSNSASPFQFMLCSDFSDKSNKNVNIVALNYLLFIYFVPYEKAFDSEYIRWRMGTKDLIEIFEKNMEFYCDRQGVPLYVLRQNGNKVEAIIHNRMNRI